MGRTDDNTSGRFASIERVSFGLALVVVPIMLAVAGWTSQEFPNRIDRYLFEVMGAEVLDGGTVYLDCWDNKPPGLCWLNVAVLWIGGRSTYAVTAAAVIAGLLAVGVMWLGISRMHGRGTATVCSLIFATILSQRYFDACTNGTELYAMVADALAAFFVVAAIARSSPSCLWCALLAGACWGLGGLFKQTAIAGPLAVLVGTLTAVVVGPGRRMRWICLALLACAGAVIVTGSAVAILQYQGALHAAYEAVIGVNLLPQNTSHVTGAFNPSVVLPQAAPITGAVLLAATGVVVTLVSGRKLDEESSEVRCAQRGLGRSVMVFMVLWALVALYGVGIGPSHMPRYWHGVFVPMMYLTAQGVWFVLGLCTRGERHHRWTAIIGAGVLAVIFFGPLLRNISDDALRARYYSDFDSERGRLIEIGDRIRGLTEPDDRIYVWGYCPGIYRFSDRRSACRFSGIEKLGSPTGFGQPIAEEIVDTLQSRSPRLIAVEERRVDALLDDRVGGLLVPGVGEWFARSYQRRDSIHGFELYVCRNP